MSLHLNKKAILKNTAQVGGLTFLSRMLGLVREALLVRFFGIGAISDAFIMSFRIPNFFRHVFAEGALSASFVPAFVKTVKENNRQEASGLMSISFLFFEGIVLLLYAFVFFKTEFVINMIAPGFSAEQTGYAIPFLRVLFPFLFFVSSSALFAGALQSVNHFFVPAFGTPLWNMIYVLTLLLCLSYNLSPMVVCFGIILGAFVQLCLHVIFYFKYNFTFGKIDAISIAGFKSVLSKFLPCLFGVSIVELNLFVSGIVASYLPKGSISLLYYGSRFMNIPLGMFAVALSSILLPHFSRVVLFAPKRLNFYILEVTKLVTWVIIPATLFLMFVSESLFKVLLGSKADINQVMQAKWILVLYLFGLIFLCLNKILLSVFYALKDTWSTTIAAMICAFVNLAGDIIGMHFWGAYGIAAANTISGIAMTILCFMFLRTRHGFRFYSGNYFNFLGRYIVQLCVCSTLFLVLFLTLIKYLSFGAWYNFFTFGLGYWLIITVLGALLMGLIFVSKRLFSIDLYFLNK